MPYTCRRCRLEVPQGLDVCPNCGAAAQRPDAVIRCRHCHRRVRSHLAVCPHCGRSVQPWRPDLPLAAVALFILAVLWLGLGNGDGLLERTRSRLVALLPPPVTPAPLIVVLDTPTPEDIGSIPDADLVEQPEVIEIAPLEPITDVEGLESLQPLTLTGAITVTEPLTGAQTITATAVITPALAIETPTPTAPPPSATPSPSATASSTTAPSRTPTPLPTARTSPTPSATLLARATATASPTTRATASPTTRATASPTSCPTQTPTSPPPATATPTATTAPTSADTYTVRVGDTLLSIAQTVGRSVAALTAFNNITDPRTLRVGQVLRIPPADYVPPTAPTPTPAPTRTRTPTPPPAATPTPAIALAAPVLVGPGDNAGFKGADAIIELAWQNTGGLPEGVVNMLHIGVLAGPDTVEWRFVEPQGQATSFRVPTWLFGQAPQEYGRTYIWFVQAASGEAPVSPPSQQRRFLWD